MYAAFFLKMEKNTISRLKMQELISNKSDFLRKTELCLNFPNCKYGSQCRFAHGKGDLIKLSLKDKEDKHIIPSLQKYR
jgi:hypothetical protein